MNYNIDEIVKYAMEQKASDIHLSPKRPPTIRVDGELISIGEELLTPEAINRMWQPMLNEEQTATVKKKGEIDFSISIEGACRLRVNLFRQRGSYGMVLRLLNYDVPTPESLGIPRSVVELTERKRGLVLVTGATGSGKSTTLASLIRIIADRDAKNIITLEDPIEFLHSHSKSVVIQREIGDDTQSYGNALRAALRQDPDVILLGEMRDLDTISTAITAAETGHLVFSTLHTSSAVSTIERIIDVFPPHQQSQIRFQLANVLEGIICQQLMHRNSEHGRVAAFEVMLSNPAIRNLIRENKVHQIASIMQTNKKMGMQMMDDELVDMYNRGIITGETAVNYAQDPVGMQQKVVIM